MKILLADDQVKVRFALHVLLNQHPDWKVVGEAAEAKELLDQVGNASPDLVLLDWNLPGLELEKLIQAIHQVDPDVLIIVLSERLEMRGNILANGADAFASKTEPPERLLSAIDECWSRWHWQST